MIIKIGTRTITDLQPMHRPYHVRDSELTGFLIRVQPSGHMSYYFDYRNAAGTKQRVKIATVGQVSPAQARDRAQELAADVIKGVDPRTAKAVVEVPTLDEFLTNAYEPWITTNRKRGGQTVSVIRSRFKFLLQRRLTEIDAWSVEKWRSQRLSNGITKQTVNKNFVLLKAALTKANEWGIISSNPIKGIKTYKIDNFSRTRFLSKEEEQLLRSALINREDQIRAGRDSANTWRRLRGYDSYPSLAGKTFVDHLRPMVILSLNTGMRRGELCQLRRENVDLAGKRLTILGAYSKNGQTRMIPLNQEALSVLSTWLSEHESDPSQLVFPAEDGQPLREIKGSWKRVLKKAAIKDFRFHDLRHTFASNLAIRGIPLNTIRELLGHSHPMMTLRYSHLSDQTKADAVSVLIAGEK